MIRQFFWKATGGVPSLEALEASHGVIAKQDVTATIGGQTGKLHPLTVVELRNGKVISNLRMVATEKDIVVGSLQSLYTCTEPEKHFLPYRTRFRMPKYRRGTALVLGVGISGYYYHWLMDSLPRWKILQAAGYTNYDYVLLPDKLLPFEVEMLDVLQIPPAKRLCCSKNFVHQFERLVVPSMPFRKWEIPPWACTWLRSLFPVKSGGPEKIYISRRNSPRRRLANEPELEAQLQVAGFVSLQTEKFSVAEQAKLFNSAKCVVSCHGGGFVNMAFSPPGGLLLELYHPDIQLRPAYQYLAAAAGHRYATVKGSRTQEIVPRHEEQAEFKIDPAAVLRAIEENQVA